MAQRIILRNGTAAEWTSANPILSQGERGEELDTRKAKVGDGTTAWADLEYTYTGSGGGAVDSVNGQTGTVVLTTSNITEGTNLYYTQARADARAAAAIAALGLGTLATQNGTFSGTHSGASSGTNTGDQSLAAYALTASLGTLATQNGTFSGTHSGTSSGTNTGDQTTVTGNAGTATALATARAINGVSFDGTAAITVTAAAGALTGSTLASGVTVSSLTTVGTLTGGATGAGFTIALSTSTVTGTLATARLSTAMQTRTIGITVDGSGTALTTGTKAYLTIPFAGTITGWSLAAKQAGAIQFDIFKIASGNTAPTTSIVASAPPALITSDQFESSTTLTSWTTSVAANDIFGFSITSISTITQVTLTLTITPA